MITQVALSLILLIGAALMAQTITRLSRVELGFPSAGLLTMRVPLPVATYDTADKRATFFEELVPRVNGLPGVRGATVVRAMPTTGGLGTNFQIDSQRIPDPGHVGQQVNTVTPGYFEAIGLALKWGRTFEPRDNSPAHLRWPSSTSASLGSSGLLHRRQASRSASGCSSRSSRNRSSRSLASPPTCDTAD